MHIHFIETFLFLFTNVFIHISTFVGQVHLHICRERNRSQSIRTDTHLLHAAAEDKDIFTCFIHFHAGIT